VRNIVYMPLDFREEHEHFLPFCVACMLILYVDWLLSSMQSIQINKDTWCLY
jgi:hypothetical protein